MSKRYTRAPRNEYPLCPRCGGPVVGAMMTSRSVVGPDGELYYHPDAVSVHCQSGSCNWDCLLAELPNPPTAPDGSEPRRRPEDPA